MSYLIERSKLQEASDVMWQGSDFVVRVEFQENVLSLCGALTASLLATPSDREAIIS